MTDTSITTRNGQIETSKEQVDYILLDGSGSMSDKWLDSLQAIDTYIATIQQNHIKSRIKVAVFSDRDLDMIARDQHIDQWVPCLLQPFGSTWGTTPLYDAINIAGRYLDGLNPDRATLTVVTDGDENGSTFTDEAQVRGIIKYLQAKGWQVTFIGADFNNSKLAQRLGISPDQSLGVHKGLLSDMAKNLGAKRTRYGRTGESMHFTDDEKQQFGGFLNAPTK